MRKIIFVFAILLLVAACSPRGAPVEGNSANTEDPGLSMSTDDPSDTDVMGSDSSSSTQPTDANTVEMDMTAMQWAFEPSTITVHQGDSVILHITSVDVTHGFMLSAFGVNERLEPGKEVTVDFIADTKGEFRFFCNVPCGQGHRSMDGKLIVE